MPPKNAKTTEKAPDPEQLASAAVSRTDITALLAEHRVALVAELKVTFFDEVNGKLDGLQRDLENHDERLTSLEDNAETLHQRLVKVETSCAMLQASNDKLKARLVDMEGRHRRSNARLVGLPEGIEGTQPSKFFAQLLQVVFGPDIFPSPPELDRAHRSSAPKPGSGERPRPVIVCFHRYQQKELLIRESRKRGELKYLDKPFRIYEDYSPEVVSQRKAYKSAMADLYTMGLKPSLLYPARLRITKPDGTRCMFGTVSEAEKFVKDFKTA
ncbi:hypothetical protein WMY93_019012 [Mugilogobius chulae]|uniref:Transposase element L1Md-A101/L1Md-A102/L1Md-A2 n=1 Tax=Mugilogobius chulae TaxID=88201 RepID=A0AAW0NQ83_9GOBI